MSKKTLIFASILILFAAFSRLLPHPPNFTPIIAMGLFGGAYFNSRSLSILIPLLAMFLADFALQTGFWLGLREYAGFHSSLLAVYAVIALIAVIGWNLKDKISVPKVGMFALLSSVLFFVVTNFSVWMFSGFYPTNFSGLVACFTAAIPFFGNTLFSTLAYSALLFGSFAYFKSKQTTKVFA